MKKIIIVGAGGFGKHVAWIAKRCGREVRGFLDDTPEKQNTFVLDIPVIDKIVNCNKYKSDEFIIALGNSRDRKKIIDKYFTNGEYNFTSIVDPSAIIGENVEISKGCVICAGSILTVDVKVGEHTIINLNSTIAHDVSIGDFVTVAPNASISGNVQIFSFVEIGTNSSIREKCIIGKSSIIGMGAVITKNINMNEVMVGNPAYLLKMV
ncbi:acetyltransferase [Acinetobacter sp. YH12255]|uniref:acetyltransferase n=1 Tax=Acinetobacter sp. YH12255 TaxID=2601179 RepID=UPI0015D0F2B4|nr:acetyltransferase [Acinetobacter sp. YH12255]